METERRRNSDGRPDNSGEAEAVEEGADASLLEDTSTSVHGT